MNGFLLPSGKMVKIAPEKMPYFDAFGKTKGNLADPATHWHLLVETNLYEDKTIKAGYPAWTDKLQAKPAKDKHFKPGKDIIDARTLWTVPASYVKDATGGDPFKPGIALYIDPRNFEDEKGNLFLINNAGTITVNEEFYSKHGAIKVIPNSIVVVECLQETGKEGKVHETGLIVKAENLEVPSWKGNGFNLYNAPEDELVRPIAYGDFLGSERRYVCGYFKPSDTLGVFELVIPTKSELMTILSRNVAVAAANLEAGVFKELPPKVLKELADIVYKAVAEYEEKTQERGSREVKGFIAEILNR